MVRLSPRRLDHLSVVKFVVGPVAPIREFAEFVPGCQGCAERAHKGWLAIDIVPHPAAASVAT